MFRLAVAIPALAVTLFASPSQGQTNDEGGFYVGGGAGLIFGGNTRSDGVFNSTGTIFDGQRLGPAPGQTAEGKFDSSPTVRLTIGYDVGGGLFERFRFEGELFHQTADTDRYIGELNGINLDPVGRVDTTMTGFVANVLYDIGKFSRVQPFVFAGYGHANVDLEYDFPGRGQVKVDGSTPTIQAGFGVDVPFNERTHLDVRYRFRRAGINELGLDTDIDTSTIQFGFRFDF